MPQEITERANGTKRVRTVYDPDQDPSRTVQSDRHKAEMKHILSKYEQVGIIDHLRNVELIYRDVTEFEDFADVMRQTKVAEGEFMKLPSKIRGVFDHSVEKWLDAAHDPEKLEELRPQLEKLGVIEPRATPERASNPSGSAETDESGGGEADD